jgi:hypothetical protein
MLVTTSRHKEKFAQPKSAACPVGIILPMRQPILQLCVQLGVQCSYVCSRECSQLRNRSALTTAGRQPAAKKMICEGGHGPQLLLLISYVFFFFRLLGQRRSGKASVNRVTRTRPADAMRKTPRQLHAAPFRRRVHADMSSMSSVRVRGGAEKPHLSPTPRGANMFFCFAQAWRSSIKNAFCLSKSSMISRLKNSKKMFLIFAVYAFYVF